MDVPISKVPELTKLLGDISSHQFLEPVKKINEGQDVDHFLSSKAYKDIVSWLLMLNASMFPGASKDGSAATKWPSGGSSKDVSAIVSNLRDLIHDADEMITTYPPDTGPRRFGNIAFRDWHAGLGAKADALLAKYLPENLQAVEAHGVQAMVEVKAYFLGSWGSAQRLDYGTGHELSFLAFLACLWKVGAFEGKPDGEEERALVLHVIHPYACTVSASGGTEY
jgi:serine/threonine-protein phosphatase 2A activator